MITQLIALAEGANKYAARLTFKFKPEESLSSQASTKAYSPYLV